MGRKRIPDSVREITGIPSTTKRPQFAFVPNETFPVPPDWLSAEASAEWDRIVPALVASGHLARIDRAALVGYVQAWELFVRAARDVADRGVIVRGARNGELVRNPMVAVARDASASLRDAVKAFGLSPAARAALPLVEDTSTEDAAVSALFGDER